MLTSSLLDGEYYDLRKKIKDEYFSIDIPLKQYSGTLESMSWESSKIYRAVHKYLVAHTPDAILLIADRWELLPAAQAAAYLSIPIVHVQGGEVSGNIDDKVRHAISQLADIHFPTTTNALRRLIAMGCKHVYNKGCPSIDIIRENNILRKIPGKYVVCMFHPHTKEIESLEDQTRCVLNAAKEFADRKQLKLYCFAPNNDPGFHNVVSALKGEQIIYNADEITFYKLLADTRVLVGNSSCGIREACYLNIPAVNVGKRQEGREHGHNIIHSSFKDIMKNMERANTLRWLNENPRERYMFGNGTAVKRIVDEMESLL